MSGLIVYSGNQYNGVAGSGGSGTIGPLLLTGRTDASCTTNGTTTVTDASCVAADVGRLVTGTDMPAGGYIVSVTAGTSFVLNAAATGSHSGLSLTIGPEQVVVDVLPAGTPDVYTAEMDFGSLASGEVIFYRAYKIVNSGGTLRALFCRSFIAGSDANPIQQTAPFPTDQEWRVTLQQQNTGSARSVPYKIYVPE